MDELNMPLMKAVFLRILKGYPISFIFFIIWITNIVPQMICSSQAPLPIQLSGTSLSHYALSAGRHTQNFGVKSFHRKPKGKNRAVGYTWESEGVNYHLQWQRQGLSGICAIHWRLWKDQCFAASCYTIDDVWNVSWWNLDCPLPDLHEPRWEAEKASYSWMPRIAHLPKWLSHKVLSCRNWSAHLSWPLLGSSA